MKTIPTICRSLIDRGVALVLLIGLAPALGMAAFLLRINTNEPILLTDDLATVDGTRLRTYRFRTTGPGTPAFRSIGHFVRVYSMDEVPGLWAVMRGEISLARFLKFLRLGGRQMRVLPANNRRPRTPRVRAICIFHHRRALPAAKRSVKTIVG